MDTNFKMENKYITMIKGDTLSIGIKCVDENNNPISDIRAVTMTCRDIETGKKIIFQKSIGDGVEKSTEDSDVYIIRVAPSDTETAETGKYVYDVEIRAGSDVFTVMKGYLQIDDDVTKAGVGGREYTYNVDAVVSVTVPEIADGSLTYKKMVNGTLGVVTPQMFGAVGDGTTDDTTAFTNFVNASGFHLIPEGTYYIEGMILPSVHLVGVNKSKCIIKCKSVNPNGDFLTFNSDSAFSIMETLSINANNLLCNAIGLVKSSTSGAYDVNMTLSDLVVYNAGKDGVKIYSETRGCSLNRVNVHDCKAWGFESIGTDNDFSHCSAWYCHNGFYLGSNCKLVGGKVFCVPYHITEAEKGGTYYAYYVNSRCNVNSFDVQQEESGITACIYVGGDNNTIHGRIDSTNGDYILFADKTNGNDVSLNVYENVLIGYGKGKHAITVPKSCLFNKINIQESKNFGYGYTIEDRSGIIPVLNTGEQNGVSMVETHTNEIISRVSFGGVVSHEDSDNIYTITAKHAVGVQHSAATVRFRFIASKTGIATTIVKVTPSAEPTDVTNFAYSTELYNSDMSTGYKSIAHVGYSSSAYGGILVGKFNVIAGNTYIMAVGSHGYSPSTEIDTTFTVTDVKIMIS